MTVIKIMFCVQIICFAANLALLWRNLIGNKRAVGYLEELRKERQALETYLEAQQRLAVMRLAMLLFSARRDY